MNGVGKVNRHETFSFHGGFKISDKFFDKTRWERSIVFTAAERPLPRKFCEFRYPR